MFDHILIGGSGFIASHLREILRGKRVLILDKKPPREVFSNEHFCHCNINIDLCLDFQYSEGFVVHHLAAVPF
jgi:nucleoside-diphosphate-sugar epimerase